MKSGMNRLDPVLVREKEEIGSGMGGSVSKALKAPLYRAIWRRVGYGWPGWEQEGKTSYLIICEHADCEIFEK